MVSTRTMATAEPLPPAVPKGRGRPPKAPLSAAEEAPPRSPSPVSPLAAAAESYEREREARIRENMERMQQLGLLDLATSFNQSATPSGRRRWQRKPETPGSDGAAPRMKPGNPTPARRSLRLKDVEPVSYVEIRTTMEKDLEGGSSFSIEEGCKEEVYTEEHEKLLGTCETPWALFVDGYGKDGKRIYDQVRGQTCHQCRQKTLGHHTRCCKCQIVQGQFCGDCLYMRYGENVLEAKSNPNWSCPVCRGICNCSICRTKKGWFPTGNAYRKVVRLGYKSVAHYLIETQRSSTSSGDSSSADSSNELPSSKSETSSVSEHAPVVKEGLKDADLSSKVMNGVGEIDQNKGNEKPAAKDEAKALGKITDVCKAKDADLSSKVMNDVGEIDQNKGNEKPAAKDEAKALGKITDVCKDADLSSEVMNEVGEIDQNKGNEKPAVKDEDKALGKITDICKDDGRNESVVTFDSLECQASQDIGCVTPSKPERKKRKLVERSPDCVASRLRSRSAQS